jgi:hypothetical protein
VDLEGEADFHALDYLYKQGKYDPAGLYSVILGLEQMDKEHPAQDPGIFRTHPDTDIRRARLEQRYQALGIKINLWHVVAFRSEVASSIPDKEPDSLRLGGKEVFTFSCPDGETEAIKRASQAADAINSRLDRYFIQPYDVDVAIGHGVATVRMHLIPVITLTPVDAQAAGMTLEALATKVAGQVKDILGGEIAKRTSGLPMPDDIMAD